MKRGVHNYLEVVPPIANVVNLRVEAGAVPDGIHDMLPRMLRLLLLLQVEEPLGGSQHRLPHRLRHAMVHNLQSHGVDQCKASMRTQNWCCELRTYHEEAPLLAGPAELPHHLRASGGISLGQHGEIDRGDLPLEGGIDVGGSVGISTGIVGRDGGEGAGIR